MNTKETPLHLKVAIAAIIIFGIFTRAYRLGDKVLTFDETINYNVAHFETVGDVLDYYKMEVHSPASQLIDMFWVRLAGDSTAAIHLEPVVWSTLTLLLFALAAFSFFPWRVAFAAVTVFSLNPFAVEFAQMFRYPSQAAFFNCLWLYFFFRYREKGGRLPLVLYALSLAASLYMHIYAVYTIAALSVCVLLFRKSKGVKTWPLLAAHAVAFAIYTPHLLALRSAGITDAAGGLPVSDVIKHLATIPVGGLVDVFYSLCAGKIITIYEIPVAALAVVIAVFGIVLFFAFFHPEHRDTAFFCATVLCAAVLLGWAGMLFRAIYFYPRFYLPLLGLFCLMLGIGADGIRRWKPAAAPAMLGLYVLFSVSIIAVYWSRLDRPENVQTLFTHVSENSTERDFINISPPYYFFVKYHWRGGLPVHDFSDDYDPVTTPHNNVFLLEREKWQLTEERLERWHEELASKYDRVWMFWMLGTITSEDRNGLAREWLDGRYEKLETRRYRIYPYRNEYHGEMILYEIKH